MDDSDAAGTSGTTAFPWATPPSGMGANPCAWCGRDIYLPALPCSIQPPPDLLAIATRPGSGERCKWEVLTRKALIPAD